MKHQLHSATSTQRTPNGRSESIMAGQRDERRSEIGKPHYRYC